MPTPAGCATFLAPEDKSGKIVVIFIDPAVGAFLLVTLVGESSPRPLTHQLMSDLVDGLGGKLKRVSVVSCVDEKFQTRMVFERSHEGNEIKLLELDSRPGDAFALACLKKVPIDFSRECWDSLPDVSEYFTALAESPDENCGFTQF
jgi:hypothetical protein